MKTINIPCHPEIKLLVDDEDYERLAKFNWQVTNSGTGIIIRRYLPKHGRTRKIRPIANEVMNRNDCIFDHKDLNPANNQKYNLRECSHGQNMANKPKRSGLTSIYKGVRWKPRQNKWEANITYNSKCIYLGQFELETEAAIAYNKAAVELHKEFAVINNI